MMKALHFFKHRNIFRTRFMLIGMVLLLGLSGCSTAAEHKAESGDTQATEDSNMETAEDSSEESPSEETTETKTSYEPVYDTAITKGTAIYDCDIEADKASFDKKADIVVGDNLYTTQINDWYENFDDYEGKVVEIEGYYINDYAPYVFVGRYGPSCPYCNGGYVSFEFVTDDDLSSLSSLEDWLKVTGILRQGYDTESGDFYYIEALDLTVMDEVGKDTVTN